EFVMGAPVSGGAHHRLWRAGRPPPVKSFPGRGPSARGRATVPDVPNEPNGPAPDLDPAGRPAHTPPPRVAPARRMSRIAETGGGEPDHETSDYAGLRRPGAARGGGGAG